MVDADSVGARLDRLEAIIEALDRVRARGLDAYLNHEDVRLATERRLITALQICIDVSAHVITELPVEPPTDYGGLLRALGTASVLEPALAERLAAAARLRNLLVHVYLDVDDERVFEALDHLDDLRAFAGAVQRLLDTGGAG